jgi:hypothetical protein
MEASKIAVDRERNRIEAQKAGLNNDPNIPNLVYDNSKSGGGYATAVFKPGISDKEKEEYRTAQAGTNHLTDLMSEYRELYGKYGNMGPMASTRMSKEEDARLRAVAAEILEARSLKYSGKAVTDKERELLKTGTPDALFATSRNIASQLADTERRERESLNRKRETLVFDLDKNSSYRQYRSGMSGEGITETKEAGMVGNGEDKRTSPTQDAVNIANKGLEKHARYAPLGDNAVSEELQADHDRFVESHPEDYKTHTVTKHFGKDDYQIDERDVNVKGFEKSLSDLAKIAASAKASGDEATYNNAVGRLQVAMDSRQNGDDPLVADYAAMKLADLKESVATGPQEPTVPDVQSAPDELDPRATLPPIPNKKKK